LILTKIWLQDPAKTEISSNMLQEITQKLQHVGKLTIVNTKLYKSSKVNLTLPGAAGVVSCMKFKNINRIIS
jgi:hypothetical protein